MPKWVREDDDGLMVGVVDGKEYKWSRYGSEKCLDVFLDLVGVLGEPFLMAIAGNTTASMDDQQRELFALVSGKLCSNLSGQKAKVMQLIKKLISDSAVCDNAPIHFDTHFRGKMFHMVKVFLAAVEAQLGDFFTDLREYLAGLNSSPSGSSQDKTSSSVSGSSSTQASAA